jgi:hypothetical protein
MWTSRLASTTAAEPQTMSNDHLTPHPPDISLILRAHGEQLWLTAEVVPIVRELEEPGAIPDDLLGAALAYLEVTWLDAAARAAETDAARAELDRAHGERDGVLREKACRYHAAVHRLRSAVARRVADLVGVHEQPLALPAIADRYASS